VEEDMGQPISACQFIFHNRGPFVVEIATTLSRSSAAVSEWA